MHANAPDVSHNSVPPLGLPDIQQAHLQRAAAVPFVQLSVKSRVNLSGHLPRPITQTESDGVDGLSPGTTQPELEVFAILSDAATGSDAKIAAHETDRRISVTRGFKRVKLLHQLLRHLLQVDFQVQFESSDEVADAQALAMPSPAEFHEASRYCRCRR